MVKTTFEYLDESVFGMFLKTNPENMMDLSRNQFDCNNCKNFWLREHPDLFSRISNVWCSNKKVFNDPDNFVECH